MDLKHADLLLVIGSSLQVKPVSEIPEQLASSSGKIPRVLVNRDPLQGEWFHHILVGDCDEISKRLAEALGWSGELNEAVFPRLGLRTTRSASTQAASVGIDLLSL